MTDPIRDLIERALSGEAYRPRVAITSLDAMRNGHRVSDSFGIGTRPEAPAAKPPADEDEALLAEVADRLDPSDLEAIRADPDVKRRFAKRLRNQRALNEEKQKQRDAEVAAAEESEKTKERNRLAWLGHDLGKAEAKVTR